MIFDGFDFAGILRCNPARKLMAPVSPSYVMVPGVDGATVGDVVLSPMTFKVAATVVSDAADHYEFSELRRLLASQLFRREPAPLVLDDDPDVTYMALLVNASDVSGWWPGARVSLTFTVYDPVGYGRLVELGLPEGISRVEVGGTYPATPTFTVRAAAGATVRVADSATGAHVQVDPAGAAREVVVDCGRRAATSGGSLAQITLSSRFFTLEPGTHELTVSGGPATLSYRERWV